MRILPPIATLLASIPALAQHHNPGEIVPTPPSALTPEYAIAWPDGVLQGTGPLGRMIAGDLDGDLRPDVIARGGPAAPGSTGSHDLLYLASPTSGCAPLRLPQTANDFDLVLGSTISPTRRLAIVDADGLFLLDWNGVTAPPVGRTPVCVDAIWRGATFVRGGELDDLPGLDFAGVAADGRTVVVRRGGVDATFDALAPVIGLELLQWQSGGAHEIAVLTAEALRVRAGTGALLSTLTPPSPRLSRIAVVRFGPAGPDRIAWAMPSAPGQLWTLDVVRNGGFNDPQISVPITNLARMWAADVDGDLDDDLVVSRTSDYTVRVYYNGTADGYLRVYHPSRVLDVTPACLQTAGSHTTVPVFADLDQDERADLLVGVQVEGQTTFHFLRSDWATAIHSEDAFIETKPFGFAVSEEGATVNFSISTKDWDAQATHVEVLAWTQTSLGTWLTPTSDGVARLYPITGVEPSTLAQDWEVYGLTLPMTTASCDMPIRWLEVRLVEMSNGVIVRAWPTYTCAIAARRADQCSLVVNEAIVLAPGFGCEGSACGTFNGWIGNWPAEAIPRRRKADPPPGVAPVVQKPPVVVGPIPQPAIGGG